MKKIFSILLLVALTGMLMAAFPMGIAAESVKLYVYNWGEYISDGSEGSIDSLAEFEKYYKATYGVNVQVVYQTYNSNEDMYAKLTGGTAHYDVIIPSDYMIARLIEEDRLEKLNYDNIPNMKYVQSEFKGTSQGGTGEKSDYYDPNFEYSVPYFYGMIGIIYNTTMVPEDEEHIGSWELMWDADYTGNILQFNNSRDAFGTAFYKLGWADRVNNATIEEWKTAQSELSAQKTIIQGYVMDEIYNKMSGGSAAIAAYYAGDFLAMYEDNEDLEFFYPSEGTNVYVDAMCIPKGSENKEIAERFINFMMEEEIAVANAEYTYYASPYTHVQQNEGYIETINSVKENGMDIIYGQFDKVTSTAYGNLNDEQKEILNELWEDLKMENAISSVMITIIVTVAAAVLLFAAYSFIQKKRRDNYIDA